MKNIYYLLRQEFYDMRKRALVFGAVIFLINLISRVMEEIVSRFGSVGTHNYQDNLGGYLFAAGFIFTSLCFATSMHSRRGQHAWFMLPVSAHEKLAAKIITYSLSYPLILILFTFFTSLVIEGIMGIIFRNTVPLFNLFEPGIWVMTGHYIVASSLFLMGASYFKSAQFIKTILSVLLFSISIGIILALVTRVVYSDYFNIIMTGNFHIDENYILAVMDGNKWERIGKFVGNFLYWVVLAPLFWTVTYFRIREKEAKDAV